jgi:hypothetical protein
MKFWIKMIDTLFMFFGRKLAGKWTGNENHFLVIGSQCDTEIYIFIYFFLFTLYMKMEQSVPKRRHIKLRRRRITQMKEYNNHNMAKVWNQEYMFLFSYTFFCSCVVLCILCSLYCLFFDVSCIVCVYMCTEQLPPGGYPIAVKYVRHPQHTQTGCNSSTIAADSSNDMTDTRCCRYSSMRSWWCVQVPPETCRVVSRYK